MSEPRRKAVKIMVIRHAEKPTKDICGVSFDGDKESESLTVRGWQRAGALVAFFAPANNCFTDPALAQPQYLYSSAPTKRNGSLRSFETLTPLAEKLAIKINGNYQRAETDRMLEEVFLCPGVVLISWQKEYIPAIANYIMGSATLTPQDWPDDRFDMVWVFDRDIDSDNYRFRQVPQTLLMGDWATPIK
jgi:hypothetical protein